MKQSLSNMTFSKCFVEILQNNKIKDICICPGSRNTPLSLSFLNNSFFRCKSHIDERAASFFSLGIAKALQKPNVILTTSGTAVANLLPAVVESDLSTTPLIVITADRPKRLHNKGENQTINQKNIFRDFIRESIHIEVSSLNSKSVFQKIQDAIDQCVGIKGKNPPGPIHLNIAFDEPLVDEIKNKKITLKKNIIKQKDEIVMIPDSKRPLIICGRIDNEFSLKDITDLSKKINAPILSDSLSGLRYNIEDENILSYYDFFINSINQKPDLIIRLGKKPVSKKLNGFLKKLKSRTILLTKYNGYNDDAKTIHVSSFKNIRAKKSTDNKWLRKIINLEKKAEKIITKFYNKNYFFEGNIIYNCLKNIDNNDNLFIGNSMCVRNLDQFCPNIDKKINLYSNRGASGIDGLIATAIGTAHVNKKTKTTLIIGDVSFFYDSNSLLIAKQQNISINIIVINNNGGQIFNTLPYAKKDIKNFEKYWETPVDLSIKKICDLYDANYSFFDSIGKINSQLNSTFKKPGINIIEIKCDKKNNLKIEKEIKQQF